MKKHKSFFDQYLDKIYDISDMLQQEGHSRTECRYKEIMATILLFIREDLYTIRCIFFSLLGILLGLLGRMLLNSLFEAGAFFLAR